MTKCYSKIAQAKLKTNSVRHRQVRADVSPAVNALLVVSFHTSWSAWGGWSETAAAARVAESLQGLGPYSGWSCRLAGTVAVDPGSCAGGGAGGASAEPAEWA